MISVIISHGLLLTLIGFLLLGNIYQALEIIRLLTFLENENDKERVKNDDESTL